MCHFHFVVVDFSKFSSLHFGSCINAHMQRLRCRSDMFTIPFMWHICSLDVANAFLSVEAVNMGFIHMLCIYFFCTFPPTRIVWRRVNYQRMNFPYPNASPPCHWTTDPLPSLPSPPLRLFVTGYLIQGSGSIHMLILPEQQLFTLLITPVVGDADLLTSHRDISMVRRGGGRNGAVWCVRAPRVEEGKKEAGLCASSQR